MLNFSLTAESTEMQKAVKCRKLSLETLMVRLLDSCVKTIVTAKALECRKQ